MAKYTNEELIEAFKEMTLVELTEFKNLFEAVSYTHLTLPTTPYV